jgi:hypothetical protein
MTGNQGPTKKNHDEPTTLKRSASKSIMIEFKQAGFKKDDYGQVPDLI